MSGYDFNFGPPWFWKLLAWFAVIGIISTLGVATYGVVWLFQHLEFKP